MDNNVNYSSIIDNLTKDLDELKKKQKITETQISSLKITNRKLEKQIESLEKILAITHFIEGSRLSDFEVLSFITDNIFKGLSKRNHNRYVIKKVRITSDKSFKEASRLVELDNLYVVSYYGVWIEKEQSENSIESNEGLDTSSDTNFGTQTLCIQMECYKDENLQDLIVNGELFEYHRRRQLFIQIVLGLIYIHEQQIVHMNLNFDNIFLYGKDRIKIGGLSLRKSILIPPRSTSRKTKFSDLQKNDIYQLGLIYFVMCYKPVQTHKKLSKFYKKYNTKIFFELPDDAKNYLKRNEIIFVQRLIDQNVIKRPNAKKVVDLTRNYLPVY
ncbi:eIF-2-alpha kinase GCN2-like [Panonychus citri]|uniref:eIF-2-alpha kinase GCN2-like n=1 Tax=Panonychus citri TaxID=50023 RepID=UPI0023071B1C|nr:eIF-2-alpha kinase GCN2-like [Panonychus citri]